MSVVVRVPPSDDDRLVAVLRDAEEDDRLVRAALRDPDNQSYAARVDGLVVGTANSSLDNIAFYQRCGFRMDSVRRDHFTYVDPPVSEFGIPMRDMIVFSYEPPSGTDPAGSRGSARTPG
jgi:hypothetical protein